MIHLQSHARIGVTPVRSTCHLLRILCWKDTSLTHKRQQCPNAQPYSCSCHESSQQLEASRPQETRQIKFPAQHLSPSRLTWLVPLFVCPCLWAARPSKGTHVTLTKLVAGRRASFHELLCICHSIDTLHGGTLCSLHPEFRKAALLLKQPSGQQRDKKQKQDPNKNQTTKKTGEVT